MGTVLVTGAAGVLGRALAPRLRASGHRVRGTSRRARGSGESAGVDEWARVDLATGEGIADAVRGADAIVHAASNPVRRTAEVDAGGTRRLCAAAREAGAAHLVYISIVGIDRVPLGYYRHKLAAEAAVEAGGTPWTILRAAQFHELIDRIFSAVRWSPVWCLPDFTGQPIDAGEVADALVGCVAAGPAGRVADVGGPEILTLREMAKTWQRARGLRRPILRLPLPGATAAGFRRGGTTCPDRRVGKIRFAEWCERRGRP